MTNNDAVSVESAALTESVRDLERRIGEEWVRLGSAGAFDFGVDTLRMIRQLARLHYLKNPLILRGVTARADYIFGRGVNFNAKDEEINRVVQAWRDDQHNQAELTRHTAMLLREVELQLDANIYFIFFVHPSTGNVRVSTIPADEITEIITDPDNRNQKWFYKREYVQHKFNVATGTVENKDAIMYYRDWRYSGVYRELDTIGEHPVNMEAVVYHVKTGGLPSFVMGVSEIYAALDWSRVYKDFLADFATIIRNLAIYAWKYETQGGASAVQAAKQRMATTAGLAGGETNPKPIAGSTAVYTKDNKLEPVKTAGATTSAEEGRPLARMAYMVFGLPEHFFSDLDTGNRATATSLSRPVELMFSNRQKLWIGVYTDILNYVVSQSVKAPEGALRGLGTIMTNEYGEEYVKFPDDIDPGINVDFPPVIEQDTQAYISALISAATLDGKQPSLITDRKLLATLLLTALGVDDVDEIVEQLDFEAQQGQQPGLGAEDAPVLEALRNLRESINEFAHKFDNPE